MKTFIVITSLALVAIGIIFFLKGCPNPTLSKDKVIDSLKFAMKTDSAQYARRSEIFESVRAGLTSALRDTIAALQESRSKFNIQGKQILATNKNLHAALIIHDTPTVYKDCERLSFQIDSIAQVKWNLDRELDGMIVLIEQIRSTDSTAIADCRGTLKKTQINYAMLAVDYSVQHSLDQEDLKKAKRGKILWGIGGGILGAAIRSIFK